MTEDVESPDESAAAERELWRRRAEGQDPELDAMLIEKYLPLARALASSLYRLRPDNDVPFGDYFQLASLGLIEAVRRFDVEVGASFATFARSRIRGAVLNGLENATERRDQAAFVRRNRLSRVQSLQEQGPRARSRASLFGEMVNLTRELAIGFMLEGGDHETAPSTRDTVLESTVLSELRASARQIVEDLPPAERFVIRCHYFYQIPFGDLAAQMELTKGRVSQIHKRALERIRSKLAASAGLDDYF